MTSNDTFTNPPFKKKKNKEILYIIIPVRYTLVVDRGLFIDTRTLAPPLNMG
jgi:hypothetical protein